MKYHHATAGPSKPVDIIMSVSWLENQNQLRNRLLFQPKK